MMAETQSSANHPGIALDQFNNNVPPGWRPGMKQYTFRRYIQRMKLWQHVTALNEGQMGPAMAGRLIGRPYDIAMGMQHIDEHGAVLIGDVALAYQGYPGNVPA